MLSAVDTNIISALWSKEPAVAGMTDLLFSARQEGGLVNYAIDSDSAS